MTSASPSSVIATASTCNESFAIVASPSSSGAMITTANTVSVVTSNNVNRDQYNYQTTNIFNTTENTTAGPSSSSGFALSVSFNDAPLDLFSAHFTGRQSELALMMKAFKVVRGDVPTRLVLYAGPGVGKTQLTLVLAKESFTQGCYKCIIQSLTAQQDTTSYASNPLILANFHITGYLRKCGRYGEAEVLYKHVLSQ